MKYTFQPFNNLNPSGDTLWVTPGADGGVQFFLTRPDLNGNELVGVAFTDPVVGPMAFCVPMTAVRLLVEGFLTVVENADELRAGYESEDINDE